MSRDPFSTPDQSSEPRARTIEVVVFTGGRGSAVLSERLIANPRISLTLAINGYDDGASTGEVRRFLRDSLGPSDFRKNASRLASELHTCAPALVELLDWRFPPGASEADARAAIAALAGDLGADAREVGALADRIDPTARERIAGALKQFADLHEETG